jgi:regulator of nonsense transcripts 1
MKKGLNIFTTDKKSIIAYLFYKILGKQEDEYVYNVKIPKNLSVRGLPTLNIYQSEAIRKALVTPLSIIQGPPGTGKTVVSATLVYHLRNITKKQVLVCAPSNIAVDHLAERIEKTGLNVVRINYVMIVINSKFTLVCKQIFAFL